MIKLTIGTCTAKKKPNFVEMADSIFNVCSASGITFEWVVVDYWLWNRYEFASRKAIVRQAVRDRFPFVHIPPKPTAWQGPQRQNTLGRDMYALCNARNTAAIAAKGTRILWMDDCSLLLALGHHQDDDGYLICSSYDQWTNAEIKNGVIVSGRQVHGVELRRTKFPEGGQVPPGWAHGANTSYLLEDLFKINGYDEVYDGQWGMEDNDRGIRLGRIGVHCFYDPTVTMYLLQDNTEQLPSDSKRLKVTIRELDHIGAETRLVEEHKTNVLLLKRLVVEETARFQPLGNPFDLRALREHYQRYGKHLAHPLHLQREAALRQTSPDLMLR